MPWCSPFHCAPSPAYFNSDLDCCRFLSCSSLFWMPTTWARSGSLSTIFAIRPLTEEKGGTARTIHHLHWFSKPTYGGAFNFVACRRITRLFCYSKVVTCSSTFELEWPQQKSPLLFCLLAIVLTLPSLYQGVGGNQNPHSDFWLFLFILTPCLYHIPFKSMNSWNSFKGEQPYLSNYISVVCCSSWTIACHQVVDWKNGSNFV